MVNHPIWIGFWLLATAFYVLIERVVYAGVHP